METKTKFLAYEFDALIAGFRVGICHLFFVARLYMKGI